MDFVLQLGEPLRIFGQTLFPNRHCHNQFRMKPSGHLFRTRHTRSLRSIHLDISHDLPLLNTTKETSGETSIVRNRIHNRAPRYHTISKVLALLALSAQNGNAPV